MRQKDLLYDEKRVFLCYVPLEISPQNLGE